MDSFPHKLLWPLTCFVLGLIAMGIGTGMYLITESRTLHSMERSTSILDFKVGTSKSPTQHAGLTWQDWRTKMAIPAAALFVLGCFLGLIDLWESS